jgi:hypothetical protein
LIHSVFENFNGSGITIVHYLNINASLSAFILSTNTFYSIFGGH